MPATEEYNLRSHYERNLRKNYDWYMNEMRGGKLNEHKEKDQNFNKADFLMQVK